MSVEPIAAARRDLAATLAPVPANDAWRLPIIDATAWFGNEPPPIRYVVDGWLARGTAGLLVGEGGVGKSLLGQQLATCVATGRPFLGLSVEKTPTLYVTCEDPENVLWARQRSINAAIGVPVGAAPAALSSLVGHQNIELGAFDPNGAFHLSEVFAAILAHAKAHPNAGLIILDNVAHFFSGNENVRRDVRAFCAALDKLAMEGDCAVLMLAHPPKGEGVEFSGSTGWNNHVRQRWWMERPDPNDRDARRLKKSKANWSTQGDEIDFRWHQAAFVRPCELPAEYRDELAETVAASHDNAVFLDCLDLRNRQERAVSESPASRTYAPKVFAEMAESKKIGRARLEAAMERLFRIGAIERGFVYRDASEGKDRFGLRRVTANPSADPSADLPLTGSADVPLTTRRPPPAHTPSLKGGMGGASEGPPPIPEDDDLAWDYPPAASASISTSTSLGESHDHA